MPTTRVVITKDGRIFVEGIGYVGEQCLYDLRRLHEALKSYGIDVKIEQQQKKPEAYVGTAEVIRNEQ